MSAIAIGSGSDQARRELPHRERAQIPVSRLLKKCIGSLRERSEPGREEAAAPKAQGRGDPAVLPERGARGVSRAKSEASTL